MMRAYLIDCGGLNSSYRMLYLKFMISTPETDISIALYSDSKNCSKV